MSWARTSTSRTASSTRSWPDAAGTRPARSHRRTVTGAGVCGRHTSLNRHAVSAPVGTSSRNRHGGSGSATRSSVNRHARRHARRHLVDESSRRVRVDDSLIGESSRPSARPSPSRRGIVTASQGRALAHRCIGTPVAISSRNRHGKSGSTTRSSANRHAPRHARRHLVDESSRQVRVGHSLIGESPRPSARPSPSRR